MATPKKPASTTRKTTTRRGPTKAAALKALGLTKEDLDALKELRDQQNSAPEYPHQDGDVTVLGPEVIATPDASVISYQGENYTPQATAEERKVQIEAKVKIYNSYKEAGLTIPADLKAEVEAYIADKIDADEPQAGPWFARNLRNVEFRMRLSRQKSGEKSTSLKPRGSRGDLVKLQPEDLEDDALIANVQLGIIEIIPVQEAKAVLAKQATNQQQAVHPAMAMLRNELGKEYEQDSVQVVGDNTYTVANLQPQGGEAGNLPGGKGLRINWEQARNVNPGPIVSDGFADQDRAKAADAIARNKNIEGPAAGLGGLSFGGLDPVQKG